MTNPLDKLREALRELSLDDLVRNTDCVQNELDRRRDVLLENKEEAIAELQTFYMRLEAAKAEHERRRL